MIASIRAALYRLAIAAAVKLAPPQTPAEAVRAAASPRAGKFTADIDLDGVPVVVTYDMEGEHFPEVRDEAGRVKEPAEHPYPVVKTAYISASILPWDDAIANLETIIDAEHSRQVENVWEP